MQAVAGKKLNKAEKLKLSFLFLEAFWFDIWFLRAWAQETHMDGRVPRGTLVSMSSGHIWGATEFIQAAER